MGLENLSRWQAFEVLARWHDLRAISAMKTVGSFTNNSPADHWTANRRIKALGLACFHQRAARLIRESNDESVSAKYVETSFRVPLVLGD